MDKNQIKSFLWVLWFSFVEGKSDLLYKKYNDYKIELDLTNEKISDCKINFWKDINIWRETTSNFSQDETLVVLECVDRLLTKWYKPKNIELEKDWPLWHKWKWFLDILVKDEEWKAFLMIECKTWWKEYENELKNMISTDNNWLSKWQLFSYFTKDRSTKYLCLYASRLNQNKIEIENSIIYMDTDVFWNCDNDKEVFEAWNKQFDNNWIFEEWVTPYNIEIKWILEKNLKNLTSDSGWIIFNQFAEILRRNVVSDKTNAFNKIFNLFICKIVDEDEKFWQSEKEMDFQWKESESSEDVLSRLNDLYKKWINEYLELKITDYSKDEIDDLVESMRWRDDEKEKLTRIITHLRLYKNNEFAFKEVFDKKTFDENSKVVKEIIKLLEKYRLRYSSKHQFLWDFFEKLLNTWIKQEAGQFFTSIPVAKFIVNSIPFENIIDKKLNNKELYFLPHIMDYASWAGHFLTEAMDRVHNILQNIDETKISEWGRMIRNNFEIYKKDYWFAKDFIYWIEKDYRLAKTTKVSCFLNWDWDANVICSDWLNSFDNSEYGWILRKTDNLSQDNPVFDSIIANPPYSVKSFKNTIKWLKNNFTLSSRLTEQSSEIECLFIERTKQLLKDWWYAWIILPVSILNNSWIYENTRELILKYFDIKAIVELWSDTFMATWTNTVILFLERKNEDIYRKIKENIDNFFEDYRDRVINWNENIFSKYSQIAYKLSLEEYINKIDNDFSLLEWDYKKAFDKLTIVKELNKKTYFKNSTKEEQEKELNSKLRNFIIEVEKEKILYFILTYNKQVVTVKMPDKQEWKDFLGYEFSNRKGYEGIKYYEDEKWNIISWLYDSIDLLSDNKVNSYIYRNFLNQKIDKISDILEWIVEIRNLNDLLNFEAVNFDKTININKKKELNFNYDLVRLWWDDWICNIKIWWTPSRNNKEYYINWNNLWVSISEMKWSIISDTKEKINDVGVKKSNVKLIKSWTTLLSFKLSIWKTAIAGKDLYTNEAIAWLEIKEEFKNNVLDNYLFYLFTYWPYNLAEWVMGKVFGKSLNSEYLKEIKIPLPPKEIQEKIVNNILEIEEKENRLSSEIDILENSIENMIGLAWWEEISFENCIIDINWKINKLKENEYKKEWIIPIISQDSDKIISWYTSLNLEKIEGDNLPLVVFWDHSKVVKYIDFPFICWADWVRLLRPDTKKIIPKLFYYLVKFLKIDETQWYSRHYKFLKNKKIKIPLNQEITVNQIEEIEEKINFRKNDLVILKEEKQRVLEEYL